MIPLLVLILLAIGLSGMNLINYSAALGVADSGTDPSGRALDFLGIALFYNLVIFVLAGVALYLEYAARKNIEGYVKYSKKLFAVVDEENGETVYNALLGLSITSFVIIFGMLIGNIVAIAKFDQSDLSGGRLATGLLLLGDILALILFAVAGWLATKYGKFVAQVKAKTIAEAATVEVNKAVNKALSKKGVQEQVTKVSKQVQEVVQKKKAGQDQSLQDIFAQFQGLLGNKPAEAAAAVTSTPTL